MSLICFRPGDDSCQSPSQDHGAVCLGPARAGARGRATATGRAKSTEPDGGCEEACSLGDVQP